MVIYQWHDKIQLWKIHIWYQIKNNNNILYSYILYNDYITRAITPGR